MQRHWQEVAPPINLSMAAFIGFKPKKVRVAEADDFDSDEFIKIATMFQT
jgi:hypothetical protein